MFQVECEDHLAIQAPQNYRDIKIVFDQNCTTKGLTLKDFNRCSYKNQITFQLIGTLVSVVYVINLILEEI